MKKVIIYEDKETGKELCRDNECLFEPLIGDNVLLDDFKLTNTKNSHKTSDKTWLVVGREIGDGYLVALCNAT